MTSILDLRPLDAPFGIELEPPHDPSPASAAAVVERAVDGLLRADLVVTRPGALGDDDLVTLLGAIGDRWHRVTGSDTAFRPSIVTDGVAVTELTAAGDGDDDGDAGQEPWTVHAGWSLVAPWWNEPPALVAVHVPDGSAADVSLLASTAGAHERLSPAFQDLLAPLAVRHDRRRAGSWPSDGEPRDGIHPLVHHDARTGRDHLVVSADHTVLVQGHTRPASRKLLTFLTGHLAQPEHTITQRWSPGTLALWVNAAVARRPIDPPTAHRSSRTFAIGGRPPDRPTT